MIQSSKLAGAVAVAAAALLGPAVAHQGEVPRGIPELDHVFVIMMENHGYGQVVGNPNEQWLNAQIASGQVSYATNYFAVGHPSLTNYLEIIGASNFGVRSDKYPNWHSTTCMPYLVSGNAVFDNNAGIALPQANDSLVCPIAGHGKDAATEAVDTFNEVSPLSTGGFNVLANVDGILSVPQAANIDGISIADQLAAQHRHWKSYQENLPIGGADRVNYSNGTASNLSNFGAASAGDPSLAPLTTGAIVAAYAAKHDPFVYFAAVQAGTTPGLSLANIVGFDTLYGDLATGRVPAFSFIAPNQCNDQHGRGNGDAFCAYDTSDDGSLNGLNPGLIAQGDATLQRLVTKIKASPVWNDGHSAIVIVWDENDYSGVNVAPPAGTAFPAQNQNHVLVTVETNYRRSPNVASAVPYNHYSLLRSIEAGLHLPCLNHACDKGVEVMSDLFAR